MKPRWTTRRRFAPVLALSLFSLPTLAAAQQTEQYRLEGQQIAIFNLAGETRVEAGAGREVTVEVTRGGGDAHRMAVRTGRVGADETLRIVTPCDRVVYPRMGRMSSSTVRVRDDGTFGTGWRGGRQVTVAGSGRGLEAYADLRIRVPEGQRITVVHGPGRVSVANVHGTLVVDGTSTSVDADGVVGSLRIDVGSGRVSAHNVQGDVDIDTGSGSVEVGGIRGQKLRVDTGSGGVSGSDVRVASLHVDVGSGRVRITDVHMDEGLVDTGSGSVELGVTGGALRSLRIDTGSGGVNLTLPRDTNADLVIDTGSGGIRVNMPVQTAESRRSYFRGRLGNGQGRIVIDTGSGGVQVREG
jgi:lia operon protein LiaG